MNEIEMYRDRAVFYFILFNKNKEDFVSWLSQIWEKKPSQSCKWRYHNCTVLHQLLITWQCRVNKCWGSVLERVRCAKHAKHVTSVLDTGMLSEGSSFFAGGCNRWFQLMGKSCRVYFGKTFACSVIFLWLVHVYYADTRISETGDTFQWNYEKFLQKRCCCQYNRKIFWQNVPNTASMWWKKKSSLKSQWTVASFFLSVSLDWLIRVKLWPVILARQDKRNGTSFVFLFCFMKCTDFIGIQLAGKCSRLCLCCFCLIVTAE